MCYKKQQKLISIIYESNKKKLNVHKNMKNYHMNEPLQIMPSCKLSNFDYSPI